MRFWKTLTKLSIGIVFAMLLMFALPSPARAAGLSLSPGRLELEMNPGSERTFPLTAYYEKGEGVQPNARLVVRFNDWMMKPDGDIILSQPGLLPRSSANWLLVSPSEFLLPVGNSQPIRVTVSVPAGTKPGSYYAAIFIEERTPPPTVNPGEKKVVLRYRLGTILYVLVPNVVRKGDLSSLSADAEAGKVVVKSVLKNMGNAHVRPNHQVEIKNAAGETVAETKPEDTPVLLPDSELDLQIELPVKLPPGEYTLVYKIDFRDEKAVQVGKVSLTVAAAQSSPPDSARLTQVKSPPSQR